MGYNSETILQTLFHNAVFGQERIFEVFSLSTHTTIFCCNLFAQAEHLEKPK